MIVISGQEWKWNRVFCRCNRHHVNINRFLEDNERQYVLNLAPAEGSRPLYIFRDKFSEEMAYLGIFLGQGRPENDKRLTPVHYSEICKSELRRSDRRAAICVENSFCKTKKLQMKILLGTSQIALRKCKSNIAALNAGVLKQQGAVERLIHLDEVNSFLRALKGSPPALTYCWIIKPAFHFVRNDLNLVQKIKSRVLLGQHSWFPCPSLDP